MTQWREVGFGFLNQKDEQWITTTTTKQRQRIFCKLESIKNGEGNSSICRDDNSRMHSSRVNHIKQTSHVSRNDQFHFHLLLKHHRCSRSSPIFFLHPQVPFFFSLSLLIIMNSIGLYKFQFFFFFFFADFNVLQSLFPLFLDSSFLDYLGMFHYWC